MIAGVHRHDFLAKQLFDRLADLDFVCVRSYFKNVLAERVALNSRLLSQANFADNLCGKVHNNLTVDPLCDFFESGSGNHDLLVS